MEKRRYRGAINCQFNAESNQSGEPLLWRRGGFFIRRGLGRDSLEVVIGDLTNALFSGNFQFCEFFMRANLDSSGIE